MQRIDEIVLEQAVEVKVICELDQNILGKNFAIVMDCLRELRDKQAEHDDWIRYFVTSTGGTKDKPNSYRPDSQYDKESQGRRTSREQYRYKSRVISKASSSSRQLRNPNEQPYDDLRRRVDGHDASIIDNIKEINLLLKDMKDVKSAIDELRKIKQTTSIPESSGTKKNYDEHDMFQSINMELRANKEKCKDLEVSLLTVNEAVKKLEEQLKNAKNGSGNNGSNSNNNAESVSDLKRSLAEDVNDRFSVLSQKLNNLAQYVNSHDIDIAALKDTLNHGDSEEKVNRREFEDVRNELEELYKKMQHLQESNEKEKKNGNYEMNKLKNYLKGLANGLQAAHSDARIESKTSLEDGNNGKFERRRSVADLSDVNEKIVDLTQRLVALEKAFCSKTSIDDRNPEKLPLIKRPNRIKEKDPSITNYPEKAVINKKDIHELKGDLYNWVRNYVGSSTDKYSLQYLYLKIQYIKRALERKADIYGMKKGLTFLENKITQLYLFLVYPYTEDAMIVRKGFNCLSCSKKVENLRGRIGPRLNWNNMTTTNYSPPRVGYSKPMGETSQDKDDDL